MSEKNTSEIVEKLSPIERKIVPYLDLPLNEIKDKSKLDETTVIRALKFLEDKEVLKIETKTKKIIDLDTNGIYYKKKGLPERRLLITLEKNNMVELNEARKISKLSDNEFKASLGTLKKKALIELTNGKIKLNANKEEIVKKSLEEQLIEKLPIEKQKLGPEMIFALENLKKRKKIVELKEEKTININLKPIGKKLAGKEIKLDLIEEVTPELIRNGTKGKKFRKYDINASVPKINGGKKHFVNQAKEYARKIWTDLGFKEMTGTNVQTSFWNFDALFTAQDHPVRDMQDTFFIKNMEGKLPNKEIVKKVKQAHENGVGGSNGWNYEWKEENAKKIALRTHTTCLSAQTVANLNPNQIPAKFFALGKVFRNETVDWSHGFEFYQTEGIVVDPNANFKHLLGYLKEFYKKMGFKKIRFTPAYFPYTEPSVEVNVFHPTKKVWLELGGAGIFRPELTIPLFGKPIPILAWGQGFDRIIMDYYKIKDLREMYSNDLKKLRKIKSWTR